MYKQSKNWAEGNGKMYVFDISETKSEIKNSNKSQQLSLFSELSQEENNNLTEEEKATILWQRKNC
jgi:hypothetical protein